MEEKKQFRWFNIALVSFTLVWGLGNVVNNYAQQGTSVVVSWLLILALYFIPYALIVGQLGSTFKESEGGVSYWILRTTNSKLAYYAAWTYWIVHIPYLAQKPQGILVALNWAIRRNGNFVNDTPALLVSVLCFFVFMFFLWLSSRGVTTLKMVGSIAGMSTLIMSFLFIILALAAPALSSDIPVATENMSKVSTYMPTFNFSYFTTVSMLVFAVGGAEKISPYINNTKNPTKEFPLGMIIMAVLVGISAVLGSVAMGILFNSNAVPDDLMTNGAYSAFQKLGSYYHVGDLLMIIYAISNTLGQIAALTFSIDAPMKILLSDADPQYIPSSLSKRNEKGTLVNGYRLTGILVSILIIVPSLGIGNMAELYRWLLNLNSVVMPIRYLWVFLAYMLINKHIQKFPSKYKFIKNPKFAFVVGLWCFLFTAFACLLGMVPKIDYATNPKQWLFQLTLNIITPIIFIVLGMILPALAKREKAKEL